MISLSAIQDLVKDRPLFLVIIRLTEDLMKRTDALEAAKKELEQLEFHRSQNALLQGNLDSLVEVLQRKGDVEAERDALKARVAELELKGTPVHEVGQHVLLQTPAGREIEKLRKRVKELEGSMSFEEALNRGIIDQFGNYLGSSGAKKPPPPPPPPPVRGSGEGV